MKKTIEQEIADITEILISISLLTLLPPVKKVFGKYENGHPTKSKIEQEIAEIYGGTNFYLSVNSVTSCSKSLWFKVPHPMKRLSTKSKGLMKKAIEQEIAEIMEILISISLLTPLPPVQESFLSHEMAWNRR